MCVCVCYVRMSIILRSQYRLIYTYMSRSINRSLFLSLSHSPSRSLPFSFSLWLFNIHVIVARRSLHHPASSHMFSYSQSANKGERERERRDICPNHPILFLRLFHMFLFSQSHTVYFKHSQIKTFIVLKHTIMCIVSRI